MNFKASLFKMLFLVATIFHAAVSSADVRLTLQASGDFPWVDYYDSASAVIANQISDDGSVASGYANLATGTLRSWSSSALNSGGVPTSSAEKCLQR